MSQFEEITKDYKDLFFHVSQGPYTTSHSHNGYWEFMLILHGSIKHNVNGTSNEVTEKSLCLLRPNDVHSIDSEEDTLRIMLGVRSEYFKKFADAISPDIYNGLCTLPVIPTSILSEDKISEILKIENIVLLSNEENRIQTLQLLFYVFAQEIMFFDLKNLQNSYRYSKPVNLLLQLISNSQNLASSMPDLIKETTYSYSHINRIFLKEVGMTLSDYLRQKRIDHAKNLLVNTDRSLKEIAWSVSYNNYSNFSIFFESATGMTPAQYRRKFSDSYKY